jgi:hypothetical protein
MKLKQCSGNGTVGNVTFCRSGIGTGTVILFRTLAEPEP